MVPRTGPAEDGGGVGGTEPRGGGPCGLGPCASRRRRGMHAPSPTDEGREPASCVRTCMVVAEERPRIAPHTVLLQAVQRSGPARAGAVSTTFGCRVNVAICLQVRRRGLPGRLSTSCAARPLVPSGSSLLHLPNMALRTEHYRLRDSALDEQRLIWKKHQLCWNSDNYQEEFMLDTVCS